ncbi:hypothetical protein [Spirochaeta lutea]|uniref:Uncharacterized protein n=1 Tax=Spirochaeta lutea TaxID=1480694 RepID=A0A098QSV1_9SPIO|nr:hypothetical protein [Spirochaeta lutea]KGE70935.1 hypothetical protein DC28_13410 [Spirochaeta lutea]
MSRQFIPEDDIKPILLKALEIQEKQLRTSSDSLLSGSLDQVSVQELQGMAKELGIAPGVLEQAMLMYRYGGSKGSSHSLGRRLLGSPPRLDDYLVLPRRLTTEDLEQLSRLLSMAVPQGGSGQISAVGLLWQSNAPVVSGGQGIVSDILKVDVSLAQESTLVRFTQDMGQSAGGVFGGIIGGFGGGVGFGVGFGVGIGALGSALFAAVFPLAALAGSYGLARYIYRRLYLHRSRTITRIKEEIQSRLSSGPPTESNGRPRIGQ